jgi:hypothetical protein
MVSDWADGKFRSCICLCDLKSRGSGLEVPPRPQNQTIYQYVTAIARDGAQALVFVSAPCPLRRHCDCGRRCGRCMESPPVSRESLISAYVAALPFQPVAIVAVPGDRCRVETAASGDAVATYWFKQSHIELLLGAAGLPEGRPIDQSPVAVAALIRRTAAAMGAPYETKAEIMAAAEKQVDAVLERVRASNQAGGMKLINRQFKAYRQAQLAKAEPAVGYQKYIEPFVMTMLRQVAMTGRMV